MCSLIHDEGTVGKRRQANVGHPFYNNLGRWAGIGVPWGGRGEALEFARKRFAFGLLKHKAQILVGVGKSDFAFSEPCAQVSEGKDYIALRL